MVFSSLSVIILFNASTLRRDLSIIFSRATLTSFILIIYINYASSYFKPLEKGLPLYNGLFQCNTNSHIFNLFIVTLSFIILNLTSYYPRKANIDKNMFLVEEHNFDLKINNSDLEDNIHLIDNTNQENNLNPKIDNNQIDKGGPFNLKGWPSIKDQNQDADHIYSSKLDNTEKGYARLSTASSYSDNSNKIIMNKGLNANSNSNSEYVIDKTGYQFKILEYPLLILFVLCGAIFLISTNDIISIFISIELQSYGLYLLSSVYRNSELSTKAGLTYFLLGGLSSCIILLSQGLLYVNSGSTNLENIYILSNISTLGVVDVLNNIYGVSYINVCLIILSVGFLFKVSAAPFHFWSPDVYDGVPTLVTTFIAIIAKISIFVFLLELVHYTSNNQTELSTYNWNNNLLISALLSLIIGSVLGLTQFRIKRLYAYSTISHVGFILLALSINTTESIQAFIFYLIQYSISNLNAFIILLAIGYFYINFYKNNEEINIHNELKERNNSPVQLITQIRGLYKLNTMLSLSFAITLFSFLGVPPLLGFFGKQMVLSASLDNGYVFMSLVAILTSVISAVYYLILIKQMFFDDSQYKNVDAVTKSIHVKLSSNITTVISTLTLITLLFMFTPTESLNLTQILSLYVMSI